MDNYLVISALGNDRPGIVNELSETILNNGCNIVDTRMAVLGGEFAVILMISGSWDAIVKMEGTIHQLEKKLDLTVTTKRTERRDGRQNMLPYTVELVSMDHPGIVHNVAEFFSSRGINIEEMITDSYAAAHTGTPMFSLRMIISVPSGLHIGHLRQEFTDFCDEFNLDAVLEPLKG